MAKEPAPDTRWAVERVLENGLFLSRWLMAPFYVGLVLALGMLLVVFVEEVVHAVPNILGGGAEQAILIVLTLIDLSLAGNLVLIVIFSGYENFVSKINLEGHEDRPSWMGTLDFSGLKIKLVGLHRRHLGDLASARLHDHHPGERGRRGPHLLARRPARHLRRLRAALRPDGLGRLARKEGAPARRLNPISPYGGRHPFPPRLPS